MSEGAPISMMKEQLRRKPPQSQEDCVAFTVRACLAANGEMAGYWRIRGACHGITKGLFGQAWETAPKAQKLAWYRMAVDNSSSRLGKDMQTTGQEYLALNQNGMAFSAIAKMKGVSRSTVAGAIYREKNPNYLEKAKEGRQRETTRNGQDRLRRRQRLCDTAQPKTERDRNLLSLYATGIPLTEVGRAFDRSHAWVCLEMKRLCGEENYRRMRARAVTPSVMNRLKVKAS